ncbi:MmgE/PrpD family protein [Nesterenkonia muleiensis]|uniref:MmgE/PrpD family protein n=1 Tax=Nesterenkonia muleiensis TaxID=2282648 RepID=UPI00130042AD|nr:MmgE/PrpD family protein [Nesterenkonia muleiensis]
MNQQTENGRANTLTAVVLDHLERTNFESLPDAAVQRAKTRLLDAVGLISAGARATGSQELLSLVLGWGGRPEATALTTRTRVPAAQAALTNAVLMRSYDFEPVGADRSDGHQIPAHITGTTAAVALAVAERESSTGAQTLHALICADDLAARLGHAVGFDVYGGGDNTGTINVVGGTVVAGLLMGLRRDQFRHALGLAINQTAGTIQNIFDKTTAFKLPIGLSARNAVFSAELAAAGWTGPLDPFGARFGFLNQWSRDPDPERITAGLGEEYFADAVIKPWPSCRASQPSLDAAVQLVQQHRLKPDDIARAVVHVPERTAAGFVGQPFQVGEVPEVSAAFSIEFAVATALQHGTVRLEHLTEEHMVDPCFAGMLGRVSIVGDLSPDSDHSAELEVHLHSGRKLQVGVSTARGDISFAPLTALEVEQKFRRSIAWAAGADRQQEAQSLLETLTDFEQLEDITVIGNALADLQAAR